MKKSAFISLFYFLLFFSIYFFYTPYTEPVFALSIGSGDCPSGVGCFIDDPSNDCGPFPDQPSCGTGGGSGGVDTGNHCFNRGYNITSCVSGATCTVSFGDGCFGCISGPPPTPNCDRTPSCSGTCTAPANTCSTNNGTMMV